jgi:hypothetical protein
MIHVWFEIGYSGIFTPWNLLNAANQILLSLESEPVVKHLPPHHLRLPFKNLPITMILW